VAYCSLLGAYGEKRTRVFIARDTASAFPRMGYLLAERPKRFVVAVALACALLASTVLSTRAAAGSPTITLFGSHGAGWGLNSTSLTSPGPPLVVDQGDNVTLILDSTDQRTHTWYIDYNNNSTRNTGEPISPSFPAGGSGGPALKWNFTADRNGTFRYRSSRGQDGAMWGNITIRPAGSGSPFLGLNTSVLILVGVAAVIVAVLVIAARSWRHTKEPPLPPPPEE
jgi:FtsP/CotA-like multicopper oxidase with cupredoxin domain